LVRAVAYGDRPLVRIQQRPPEPRRSDFLEIILSKIPKKSNARRLMGGGQENPSARGQKISGDSYS